jgi:hypothetical protein
MKIITNYPKIADTEEFKKFESEFDTNIEFLEEFSNLVGLSGRIISFISPEKVHIVPSTTLDSAVQTLKSIKLCCSLGNFADANTLIRKLRDDLLLYVYILSIINRRKTFTDKSMENFKIDTIETMIDGFSKLEFNESTDDERAVQAWLSNGVLELPYSIKKKLSFENYMKVIRLNKNIDEILNDYKLEKYWEFLRGKLNDYVHNNGFQFTQHNLVKSHNSQLNIYFENANTRTSYVVTFFLVLITMVESALLCSGEIEDYLDMGLEPHENCENEIAPFIQAFIDTKVVAIHPELKEYLKNNNSNGMTID